MEDSEDLKASLNVGYICNDCIDKYKQLFRATKYIPQAGDHVKIDLKDSCGAREMIWTIVDTVKEQGKYIEYIGTLDNDPLSPEFSCGDFVWFSMEDILLVMPKGTTQEQGHAIIMKAAQAVSKEHFEKHEEE